MNEQSRTSGINALRTLLRGGQKVTANAFARGQIVHRVNEGELMYKQLASLMKALELDGEQ